MNVAFSLLHVSEDICLSSKLKTLQFFLAVNTIWS